DKLEGPYRSFHDNGKPQVTATYKEGKLTGTYTEETPEGQKRLTAAYKDGKLEGTVKTFEKGAPALTLIYKDGALAHKRTFDEMKKKVDGIIGAPVKDGTDIEREGALRRLKIYRYLVELPYDDIVLDPQMNKEAQAAALICDKLKQLNHNPPNPG